MDEDKTAIDQAVEHALDLLVFAPVGLALAARDELPGWVAKGRERVTGQLALAKMFGQFAVRQGQREARQRAEQLIQQAADVAERMASRPAPKPTAPASDGGGGPMAERPVEHTAERPAERPVGSNGSHTSTDGAAPSAGRVPTPASVADLAIPGYDTLSASQVVQRLAGLSAAELVAVGDYETATRGRRTILAKVALLQAPTPSPPARSVGPTGQAE